MAGQAHSARVASVGVPVLAVLVGGLVWTLAQGPAERAVVNPVPIPLGDPVLAVQAGGDSFAALAPSSELATRGPGSETTLAYETFGYFDEGDFAVPVELRVPTGEWTNKAQLWDSLAPRFADEVRRLGSQAPAAPWPKQGSQVAGAPVVWSNRTTQGRGELVEFFAFYTDAPGRVVLRVWPTLVATLPDGSGRVAAQSPAVDVPVAGPDGTRSLDDLAAREWAWVMSQPPS